MRVGIIGYGSIGRSLARGILEEPGVMSVVATTRSPGIVPQDSRVLQLDSNRELVEISDVVFVAVKPWQVKGVLEDIAPHLIERQGIISVASAVSSANLRRWSGKAVVRAMPNLPCQIREGMTVIARDEMLDDADLDIATKLLRTVGRVVVLDEQFMDGATAISGCGPAYAYVIIESLVDAGVKLGLPRTIAQEMVAQTFVGASRTVLECGLHPAALKDEVTTPGGCTIDGLLELEKGNIRASLIAAVVAAAARSRDMQTAPDRQVYSR